MNDFTPLPSLLGGLLIGAGACLLLLFNGRIAGISGITSGVVIPRRGEIAWRWVFLAGLLVGGLVAARIVPRAFDGAPRISWLAIVAAEMLSGNAGLGRAQGLGGFDGGEFEKSHIYRYLYRSNY